MQLSEIFRIGIVVPLDSNACMQLKNGAVNGPIDVTFLPLRQQDFISIWHSELFQELGSELRITITDYEDYCIEEKFLSKALLLCQEKIRKFKHQHEMSNLLEKISVVMESAIKLNYPMFLIF